MAMGRRSYHRLRISSPPDSFPMAHISRVPHDLLNVKGLRITTHTPCIKKLRLDVDCSEISAFWDGLSSPKFRSVYLAYLEEFHVLCPALNEYSMVINATSLASKSILSVHNVNVNTLWRSIKIWSMFIVH